MADEAFVHRCGPGPCKDCRLEAAEREVARLRAELSRVHSLWSADNQIFNRRIWKLEDALVRICGHFHDEYKLQCEAMRQEAMEALKREPTTTPETADGRSPQTETKLP